MNKRNLIPAAAVALIVAAGCGGSQVTAATKSTPQSSASATTKAEKPTPKHEFAAFLAKVQPPRKKSNDMFFKCNKFYDNMQNDSAYTGWDAAGQCAKRDTKIMNKVSDQLAAIVPPAHLRHTYLAYVRSYRSDAEITSDLAYTINHHQFLDWDKFNPRYTSPAVRNPVTNFRVAVIAYAAAHDYPVPGWVHHIGG